MTSHPDADAFLRAILRDPADVTTRLIFADWLEETEDESNIAWARYIRLNIEMDACDEVVTRERLNAEILRFRASIRACLTVPASLLVEHSDVFIKILPASRLSVRLLGFTPNPLATLLVEAQFAQVHKLFPIGVTRSTLLVAIHKQKLIEPNGADLSRMLGIPVIAVAGEPEEIESATRRTYPTSPPHHISSTIY